MATNLAVSPGVCCFFFVFGKWLVPSFAFLEKIVPSSASSYLFSKVKLFGASILTLNAITPLYYSFRVYTFFLLGAFFFSFPMWLHIFTLLCVSLIDFFLLLPFRDIKLFPRIDSIWNLYGHSHIHCSKVMSVYYAMPVITIWDYLFFFPEMRLSFSLLIEVLILFVSSWESGSANFTTISIIGIQQ